MEYDITKAQPRFDSVPSSSVPIRMVLKISLRLLRLWAPDEDMPLLEKCDEMRLANETKLSTMDLATKLSAWDNLRGIVSSIIAGEPGIRFAGLLARRQSRGDESEAKRMRRRRADGNRDQTMCSRLNKIEVRLIYLEICKHRRPPHRHRPTAQRKNESKIAAGGDFEGVQLLSNRAPTHTTHVHWTTMVPS